MSIARQQSPDSLPDERRDTILPNALPVLVIAAAIVTGSPAVLDGFDLRAKIEPFARPLIDEEVAVGFVVGVVKGGETQIIGYGETAKGSGVEPDANTVYEIGSISKVFTGILLASMVERRLLKLDDPLRKHLPASVKVPQKGEAITLEHLATHRSGLPRLPDNITPTDPRNPYADYTVKEMYEFLSAHELRRSPGRYEYSNCGMGLLGHVLARKAKTSYEKLLLALVCKPLRLTSTRVHLSSDMRRRLAPPYDAGGNRVRNWDFPTLTGAGGIHSTVNDMLKFTRANLDARDKRNLTRALELSRRRQRDAEDGPAMGLGWHIARDGVTLWHNGMTGGYHSSLYVNPELKVGVVVLANTATERITQLGEQVLRIASGAEVTVPTRREVVNVDPAVLESYAGRYRLAPGFILTVTVEGDKKDRLMVQATGQQKLRVFPESKTEFFYKVVEARITFKLDAKGNVTGLVLHQAGRDMPGPRAEGPS